MGIEIVYDRAFIKADDAYIPLLQTGSSNCWDILPSGRYVPEKNWSCFRGLHNNFKHSLSEIEAAADIFSTPNTWGEYWHISRNRTFSGKEQARKWFMNGVKSAFTVQEYTEFGNNLYLSVLDFSSKTVERVVDVRITTTQQLLTELENALKTLQKQQVLRLGFRNRDINRPRHVKPEREKKVLTKAYCIQTKSNCFLYKVKKYGFKVVLYPDTAKKFRTQTQAQKYLAKYLQLHECSVVEVQGTFYV